MTEGDGRFACKSDCAGVGKWGMGRNNKRWSSIDDTLLWEPGRNRKTGTNWGKNKTSYAHRASLIWQLDTTLSHSRNCLHLQIRTSSQEPIVVATNQNTWDADGCVPGHHVHCMQSFHFRGTETIIFSRGELTHDTVKCTPAHDCKRPHEWPGEIASFCKIHFTVNAIIFRKQGHIGLFPGPCDC